MCPGGEVFAAASESGGVATNGMSYSRRDGENANSALLVTLHPEDFPDKSTLGGMYWQREIERAAYAFGGGNYLPRRSLRGFFSPAGRAPAPPPSRPATAPASSGESCARCFRRITAVLEQAIPALGKKALRL